MSAGNHITGVINMSLTLSRKTIKTAGWLLGGAMLVVVVVVVAGDVIWSKITGGWDRAETTPRYTSYSKLITLGWLAAWQAQLTFYFEKINQKQFRLNTMPSPRSRHFTPIIGLVLAQGTQCYD